jgi:hypothetical protein
MSGTSPTIAEAARLRWPFPWDLASESCVVSAIPRAQVPSTLGGRWIGEPSMFTDTGTPVFLTYQQRGIEAHRRGHGSWRGRPGAWWASNFFANCEHIDHPRAACGEIPL